ncbi:hypothetical protein M2132_002249 [Dysgonomonas sp. PH5-45]|uniref:porin family protein n=1 Tax=unclassified Dysgonomonas TaxID=2630389 RepID=UPI002476E1CC|nr:MULTISPECIES: porin family protein [unclassified Dysgonomonas]MDH6355899.1 hypothetical protein [Dysgonomonas sp. PH5-45]MDH6388793.1 hypothetical protein [Dysgonomonas sp. PH5-37]
MAEREDNIKDIFYSGLKDFEPEVPAGLWAGIESSMSFGKKITMKPKPKYSLAKVASIAASFVAVAAIAAVIVWVQVHKPEPPQEPEIIAQKIEPQKPDTIQPEVVKAPPRRLRKPRVQVVEPEPVIEPEPVVEPVPAKKARGSFYAKSSPTSGLSSKKLAQLNIPTRVKKSFYTNRLVAVQDYEETKTIKTKKEKKESLVSLQSQNNLPTYSIGIGSQGGFAFNDAASRFAVSNIAGSIEEKVKDFVPDASLKMDHDQPISVGLSISKRLSSRFSLQTGLRYTYLRSKGSETSGVSQIQYKQKLHYLGVPLVANYDLISWNKLNLYISLGGMMQKDISGKYEWAYRSTNVPGSGQYSGDKSIGQDHLQFSMMSSLGLSYPIYDKLRIYTTFGGAYYFDANNKYQTIFSEKKFQFDLNVGFKYEF